MFKENESKVKISFHINQNIQSYEKCGHLLLKDEFIRKNGT